jgi:hypothetical protein
LTRFMVPVETRNSMGDAQFPTIHHKLCLRSVDHQAYFASHNIYWLNQAASGN